MDLLNALYILREDTKRLAARLAAYERDVKAGRDSDASAAELASAARMLLAGPSVS